MVQLVLISALVVILFAPHAKTLPPTVQCVRLHLPSPISLSTPATHRVQPPTTTIITEVLGQIFALLALLPALYVWMELPQTVRRVLLTTL